MSFFDYTFGAAVLLSGTVLAAWYGASWRAVARALEAARRTEARSTEPDLVESRRVLAGTGAPTAGAC